MNYSVTDIVYSNRNVVELGFSYLPFLMVFRPMRGSSTASIDSPIFSIKTQSPLATARSIVSRNLKQTL